MRSERQKLVCSHCGKEFSARIVTQVDFCRPEDRDVNLSDGSLFTYRCSHCGKDVYYNHYLLWVDEGRKVAVCNLTCEEEKAAMEEALSALSAFGKRSDIARRYVTSPPRLFEKTVIFSAGLDDRTVELAKQFLAARLLQDRPGMEISDILLYSAGEEYGFVIRSSSGDVTVNLPKTAFDEIAARFPLSGPAPETVDGAWAVAYLTGGAK